MLCPLFVRPLGVLVADSKVLTLRRENGKCISAPAMVNGRAALIVWRKSGAPLLTLYLDSDEAAQLADMLHTAIGNETQGTTP